VTAETDALMIIVGQPRESEQRDQELLVESIWLQSAALPTCG